MQQLALGWWAYRISDSVAVLAAMGVCTQLPILLLGPWAASLADHVERRRGVLWTQCLSMGHALVLLGLYFSDKGSVPALIAAALFLGVVNAFDIPLRQSYAAHLVPSKDLKNAIAISAMSANGTRLIAPTIGGLVIAFAGEGVCFAVNALSYCMVVWALSGLPDQPAMSTREEGVGWISAFKDGAAHAFDDPWMASGLAMALLVSLCATPYLSLMPALVKDAFKAGPDLYGLAMGASGVGAMVSGIAMAARPGFMSKRFMPWLGILGGGGLAAMAWMPNVWWAMPFLALAGFGLSGGASSANAMLQSRVSPQMRGRVMGMFSMCLYGSTPIGLVAMGWLAEHYGSRLAISSGGGILVIGCAVLVAWMGKRAKNIASKSQADPTGVEAIPSRLAHFSEGDDVVDDSEGASKATGAS